MNITRENLDNLNAVLKLEISGDDYAKEVSKALKNYQMKANIPGFRPGKVPMGMIKKMYGKSIVAEEVNKLAYDNLLKYIKDNNIDILGSPLPNIEKTGYFEFEEGKDFTLFYDLGIAPEVNFESTMIGSMDYLKIVADDKFIDEKVDEMRRRYGKYSNPEVSDENDWLFGKFVELAEDGSEKEGGIQNQASLLIDAVKYKKDKKVFVGLKQGDKVTFDPSIFKNATDTAAMLGVSKEVMEENKSLFSLEVERINRVELAEINQALFDKLYGENVITSEEEMRGKVKEEFEKVYAAESDRKLLNDIVEVIIEKTNIDLPDAFLQKWLIHSSEGKITSEQIEKEYTSYAKSLKWQIIENKLMKDNDINVSDEDVLEYAKGVIKGQLAMYGKSDVADEELKSIAMSVFKNKEELKRLYDKLYDDKLIAYFKGSVELKEKEVTFDKFLDSLK